MRSRQLHDSTNQRRLYAQTQFGCASRIVTSQPAEIPRGLGFPKSAFRHGASTFGFLCLEKPIEASSRKQLAMGL